MPGIIVVQWNCVTAGWVPNVNPLASRDAKVMPLAMSNARASEAPSQGADDDFVYAFNYFQYVDTFNFWAALLLKAPLPFLLRKLSTPHTATVSQQPNHFPALGRFCIWQ